MFDTRANFGEGHLAGLSSDAAIVEEDIGLDVGAQLECSPAKGSGDEVYLDPAMFFALREGDGLGPRTVSLVGEGEAQGTAAGDVELDGGALADDAPVEADLGDLRLRQELEGGVEGGGLLGLPRPAIEEDAVGDGEGGEAEEEAKAGAKKAGGEAARSAVRCFGGRV